MNALFQKRVALITGKGGVGRTAVTGALALAARKAGKRVLVAEISDGSEGYSPLARYFGLSHLPASPAAIADGILGTQLRSDAGVELFLSAVIRVQTLARAALEFEPLRRLFVAVPSLRELGIFYHLLSHLRAKRPEGDPAHELILVDMPATGHTLALTGLPQVILKLMSRGPIADALREGQSYLNDPEQAGAYVVTLPEELPISEALELLEGLRNTSVPVGGVFVNRVPPARFTEAEVGALRSFFQGRTVFGGDTFERSLHAQKALERLRASTSDPLLELPELPLTGRALPTALAEHLSGALT